MKCNFNNDDIQVKLTTCVINFHFKEFPLKNLKCAVYTNPAVKQCKQHKINNVMYYKITQVEHIKIKLRERSMKL